jgi:hypothetical protein
MARYKRSTLEAKTVKELRSLVVQLGIKGMTKRPKEEIIAAIFAKHGVEGKAKAVAAKKTKAAAAPPPLTAVEGNFSSKMERPNAKFGHKTSTTVRVSCGASSISAAVIGKSVKEVGEFMREVLNVSKLSTGLVNGQEVGPDYKLKEGDNLEFLKPAGSKGC